MSPGIAIRDLNFSYPARRAHPTRAALRGIDLDIAPGQTVAVLGPNGSGKSSLVKILCGMHRPDRGTVRVFGAVPADSRAMIGVVFQFDGLDRHLTVQENLRDQAALYGIGRRTARARIDDGLARANLADRRRSLVKTLSRGLARRADLVRALLHEPRLLLLDEPTAGLDPVAREAFLARVLVRGPDSRRIVLLSTHLIDEAERCDRVVLLHEGRVVADDRPAALRERYGDSHLTTIRVTALRPPDVKGLDWRPSDGDRFTADTDDGAVLEHAAQKLAAAKLAFSFSPPTAPTLAEVFERLTGAALDGDASRTEAGAP